MTTISTFTVDGPRNVWAFDFDATDDFDEPITVGLVRSTGSVLVEIHTQPRHTHLADGDSVFPSSWLWETPEPIIVPSGQSVTMIVSRTVRPYFEVSALNLQ